MRETGYYWVKLASIWSVCNYNKRTQRWTVPGYDGFLIEEEIQQIGENQIKRHD